MRSRSSNDQTEAYGNNYLRTRVLVFFWGAMMETSNMSEGWTEEVFGIFCLAKPPPPFRVGLGCENR